MGDEDDKPKAFVLGTERGDFGLTGADVALQRQRNLQARRAELNVTLADATLLAAGRVLPAITVKAILQFGDTSTEGQLVEGVAVAWYELLEFIKRDPDRAHEIGGRRFEELIAGAYERAGYDEVTLTPHKGDKGRDVIAVKRGVGCIRIVDQVKAYKPDHVVDADEVRAMVGVLGIDPNASKGVVTTTSTFAPRLLLDDPNLARLVPYRLELKDRDALLPWLDELAKRKP